MDDRNRNRHYSQFGSSNSNPSFSSSLLDEIYRSFDQGEDMRTQRSFWSEEEMANFQRATMIEKWMGRKSAMDLQNKKFRKEVESSSWSSDDSSCGGGGFFYSSEMEMSSVQRPRPRPIRTGSENGEVKGKNEGGISKSKSRAMKIYCELKKVKQPISPGGKLVGILNSLFAAGNLKKHKIVADDNPSPPKSGNTSTCSSASSFSRSCLSKTPSSRGKSSTAGKRSVRFSPVSVIVDDDSNFHRPHLKSEIIKNTSLSSSDNNANSIRDVMLMIHKNRRVDGASKDMVGNYNPRRKCDEIDSKIDHPKKSHIVKDVIDQNFEDEEDDDDAASCASSDLFELENLSGIGIQRYDEELPVYETTHLHTNRAIAKGLIM